MVKRGSWALLLVLFCLTTLIVFVKFTDATDISACGTLASNTNYTLTNNVTSLLNTDCFEVPVAVRNVTFNCNYSFVIGNISTTPNIYGFDLDASNVIIENCNFLSWNSTGSAGVFVTGNNNQVINTTNTNGSLYSMGINNAINTTLNNTVINGASLRLLGTASGVYISNFSGGINVINTVKDIIIYNWNLSYNQICDFASTVNNTQIDNLDMHDNYAGLYLRGYGVNISNSRFYNSSYFIVLTNASNVNIVNLSVSNVTGIYSVGGDGTENITIRNSTFSNSTNINFFQSIIFDSIGNFVFENNVFNGTPVKLTDISNQGSFNNNSLWGLSSVDISNASNIRIFNNSANGNASIRVYTVGTNITMFRNSFSNSYYGLNDDGLILYLSNITGFSIYDNNLTNVQHAITVRASSAGQIYNNVVNITNHGVLIDFSSYNVSARNNIVYNAVYAYLFRQLSHNNSIHDNLQYNGGIFYSLHSARDNIAYNNYIDGNLILLDNVTNEFFYNNTVTGNLTFEADSSIYKLTDIGGYGNTIQDTIVSGGLSLSGNSTNNTLLNVSWSGNESINTVNVSSFIRKFYFNASTNVTGANITLSNSTSVIYSVLSGSFVKQNLTAYTKTGATATNITYTINATKNGYTTFSSTFNVTPDMNLLLNLTDIASPNVTLNSPADSASSNETSWTFSFNVTDDSEIGNCTLYLNGIAYRNTSFVNKSASNTISLSSLSAGDYPWYVNCIDVVGNSGSSSSRSFTIEEVVSSSSTTSSGGTPKVYVNNEVLNTGYDRILAKNWEIKFYLNGENHTIKINNITNDSATITIYSTPQTTTLFIGEEKKFDLNSDNYYDLYIKLNSISNNYGNFTIKAINERIITSTNEPTKTPQETQANSNTLYLWLILIITIIVIVILIIKIRNKSK